MIASTSASSWTRAAQRGLSINSPRPLSRISRPLGRPPRGSGRRPAAGALTRRPQHPAPSPGPRFLGSLAARAPRHRRCTGAKAHGPGQLAPVLRAFIGPRMPSFIVLVARRAVERPGLLWPTLLALLLAMLVLAGFAPNTASVGVALTALFLWAIIRAAVSRSGGLAAAGGIALRGAWAAALAPLLAAVQLVPTAQLAMSSVAAGVTGFPARMAGDCHPPGPKLRHRALRGRVFSPAEGHVSPLSHQRGPQGRDRLGAARYLARAERPQEPAVRRGLRLWAGGGGRSSPTGASSTSTCRAISGWSCCRTRTPGTSPGPNTNRSWSAFGPTRRPSASIAATDHPAQAPPFCRACSSVAAVVCA